MLGYYAIHAPDTKRAKDFYAAVFGWTYESQGDYHHIAGSSPAGGIAAGEPLIDPAFVVEDAATTAARAHELGGTATDPKQSDSGWSFEVTDGHGGRLGLWQPAEKYRGDNPKGGEGDVFYFVQPAANDEARAFYTALLGWERSHPALQAPDRLLRGGGHDGHPITHRLARSSRSPTVIPDRVYPSRYLSHGSSA
jgi:predicted enzyme related to lactoylglutathione lyase